MTLLDVTKEQLDSKRLPSDWLPDVTPERWASDYCEVRLHATRHRMRGVGQSRKGKANQQEVSRLSFMSLFVHQSTREENVLALAECRGICVVDALPSQNAELSMPQQAARNPPCRSQHACTSMHIHTTTPPIHLLTRTSCTCIDCIG